MINIESSTERSPSIREYLAFKLGSEEYGIDILRVQEIRSFERPTRIAYAPPHVLGVVNLRGVIAPVVDLRVHFNLREVNYDELTSVIVLNIGRRLVGMVVNAVSDVIALKNDEIKPSPDFQSDMDTEYITGIATVEQGDMHRMLILMDIEKLLNGSEIGLAE